jgi:hypothetical protein
MITVYLIRNKKCIIESNTKMTHQVAVPVGFLTLRMCSKQKTINIEEFWA